MAPTQHGTPNQDREEELAALKDHSKDPSKTRWAVWLPILLGVPTALAATVGIVRGCSNGFGDGDRDCWMEQKRQLSDPQHAAVASTGCFSDKIILAWNAPSGQEASNVDSYMISWTLADGTAAGGITKINKMAHEWTLDSSSWKAGRALAVNTSIIPADLPKNVPVYFRVYYIRRKNPGTGAVVLATNVSGSTSGK